MCTDDGNRRAELDCCAVCSDNLAAAAARHAEGPAAPHPAWDIFSHLELQRPVIGHTLGAKLKHTPVRGRQQRCPCRPEALFEGPQQPRQGGMPQIQKLQLDLQRLPTGATPPRTVTSAPPTRPAGPTMDMISRAAGEGCLLAIPDFNSAHELPWSAPKRPVRTDRVGSSRVRPMLFGLDDMRECTHRGWSNTPQSQRSCSVCSSPFCLELAGHALKKVPQGGQCRVAIHCQRKPLDGKSDAQRLADQARHMAVEEGQQLEALRWE